MTAPQTAKAALEEIREAANHVRSAPAQAANLCTKIGTIASRVLDAKGGPDLKIDLNLAAASMYIANAYAFSAVEGTREDDFEPIPWAVLSAVERNAWRKTAASFFSHLSLFGALGNVSIDGALVADGRFHAVLEEDPSSNLIPSPAPSSAPPRKE